MGFAWRSLVRQPARATLAVLGVAAVGALLFDMLMLSQGLITSMRDLLDQGGWDIRVSAGDLPRSGPLLPNALDSASAIAALPSVRATMIVRGVDASIERPAGRPLFASLQGATIVPGGGQASPSGMPWTVLRGRQAQGPAEIVVSEVVATTLTLAPGDALTVRASCGEGQEALPATRFEVVGVGAFPFASANERTLGGTFDALTAACGGNTARDADLILVTSTGDAAATTADIRRLLPGVSAATNDEVLGRLQETGFTYFRQISSVLTSVTVSFAVLLITVLLTVSVNQRLGEVAALRALGFSRTRVITDVLSESALIVGAGGLLSLPLGLLLAEGLDRILKAMPGIPASLHFFVFEPRALVVHATLLAATALIAALYPVRIVARLPIAATLRDEVIG